jgi:predicted permease
VRWRERRAEDDFEEEIRAHIALETDRLVGEGLSPDEARAAARRSFGNVARARERFYESRRVMWLDDLRRDARHAVRGLARSPAFAAAAVLTLALGVGAATAIFSLVNALMLRELPVREPGQLVELLSRYPGEPRVNGFPWRVYEHYRDESHVFSELIATSPTLLRVGGERPGAEAVAGEYVAGGYFPALGIEPAVGRLIDPADERPGPAGAGVAVISWSYWQRRLGRDPSVLGRRIVVDGAPAAVVGVAPRGFFGLQVGVRTDLWLPAPVPETDRRAGGGAGGGLGVKLLGRLRRGVSIEGARAEMRVLDRWRTEDLARRTGDPRWRQAKVELAPAPGGFSVLRDAFGGPLLVLLAVASLLLLLACGNVACMLLARGVAREREMAMRVSLGAGRLRLARQVATESLLLAMAGSLLGVLTARLAADALVRILTSGRPIIGLAAPVGMPVPLDAHVLSFTVGLVGLTALLFGLAPAASALAASPASSLRSSGTAGGGGARARLGRSLVVGQVALSVLLLSAANVLLFHLSRLRSRDLGFERGPVLLVTLDPAASGLRSEELTRLYPELLGRLGTIPGVRSTTLSGLTPIEGPGAARRVSVEGFGEDPAARRYVALNWVAPRYFETFGTPRLAGRDFRLGDAGRELHVAIVNRALARHYFGAASPIGRRFTFEGQDRPYEIVGVVGDAKYASLHEPPPRTVYLDALQEGVGRFPQIALRTRVPATAIVSAVRSAVRDVMRTVPVTKVTTLDEQVDASIVPERLAATLSGWVGVVGMGLAAAGLYGLLAYAVARRTHEIGIRVALGATRRSLRAMVLRSALGSVGAGLALGVPIALGSRRLAAGLMGGLPVDSVSPVAVAVMAVLAVGLVAAYVPARRATRVDPLVALRHE